MSKLKPSWHPQTFMWLCKSTELTCAIPCLWLVQVIIRTKVVWIVSSRLPNYEISLKLCCLFVSLRKISFWPYQRTFFHCSLEREEGREEGGERNIDVREKHHVVASCRCSDWGSNPQSRHVPWLGIKPATVQLQELRPTGPHQPGLFVA